MRRRITDPRIAVVALGGCAVAVVAWVVTAGPAVNWRPNPGSGRTPTGLGRRGLGTCPDGTAQRARPQGGYTCEGANSHGLGLGVVGTVIQVVLQVLAIGFLIALLAIIFRGWRRRPRVGRIELPPDEKFLLLPDIAGAIADDVEAQLAVLRDGSPRNAIVACWARLEDTIGSAGLALRQDETSTELTVRILSRYLLHQTALLDLARLYREARFSTHEITESKRDEAFAALRTLHADLRSQRIDVDEEVEAP